MTPREKISVEMLNVSPIRISGDMYASVPQNVRRRISSCDRGAIRAKPKSVILTRPFEVRRRFSGLRSLWMHCGKKHA